MMYLSILIRMLVTTALLWFFVSRIDIAYAITLISALSPLRCGIAIVLLAAAAPINAIRWRIILGLEGKPPTFPRLFGVLLIGLFFNQVLPTGIGGDAVRAWRLRDFGFDLGVSIRSILLDRAVGYCVFVLMYVINLPLLLPLVSDQKQRWALIAIAVATTCGIFVLLIINALRGVLSRFPAIAPIAMLSRRAWALCTDIRQLAAVLALSGASSALTILSVMVLADGLDVRLSFATWFLIMPPVILVQLVPISLAGWGVRETALIVMLAVFRAPTENALAVSLLVGLSQLACALPGGIIWLAGADIGIARGSSLWRKYRAEMIDAPSLSAPVSRDLGA
jgi:glycosyltransferase 2 family protein